jgi:hypothetical protein
MKLVLHDYQKTMFRMPDVLPPTPKRLNVLVLRILDIKVTFFFFITVRFGDSFDISKLMNMQLCLEETSTILDISFQFFLLLTSEAVD